MFFTLIQTLIFYINQRCHRLISTVRFPFIPCLEHAYECQFLGSPYFVRFFSIISGNKLFETTPLYSTIHLFSCHKSTIFHIILFQKTPFIYILHFLASSFTAFFSKSTFFCLFYAKRKTDKNVIEVRKTSSKFAKLNKTYLVIESDRSTHRIHIPPIL